MGVEWEAAVTVSILLMFVGLITTAVGGTFIGSGNYVTGCALIGVGVVLVRWGWKRAGRKS